MISPSAASSDRQVKLHPLVLINISEHYTREKCRPQGSPLYTGSERVAGVLFGVQRGNTVDIYESFEMLFATDYTTGVLKFDEGFLQRKKAQCELFMVVCCSKCVTNCASAGFVVLPEAFCFGLCTEDFTDNHYTSRACSGFMYLFKFNQHLDLTD